MAAKVWAAVLLGTMVAWPVLADWNPGDPQKMHFPQLPNPQGWDVSMTDHGTDQLWLADDWMCTETGPVSNLHLWFSWLDDFPSYITVLRARIYADNPFSPPNYSRPGELLWEREFLPGEFDIRVYGESPQGWYDPENNVSIWPDHYLYYQLNLEGIDQPFIQELGTVYWLAVSADVYEPDPPADGFAVGWKTSLNHYRDTAVWAYVPPGGTPTWNQLHDPLYTNEFLELAFVITPEPASLLTLGLSIALVAGRAARRG